MCIHSPRQPNFGKLGRGWGGGGGVQQLRRERYRPRNPERSEAQQTAGAMLQIQAEPISKGVCGRPALT